VSSGLQRQRRWQDHGLGKILRALELLTFVIATAALIIAIVGLLELPGSRRDSARDSCYLLRGLVLTATAPGQQAAVDRYIARTPLHDCNQYAQRLVK
jgi:hypothetical protein